MPFLCNCLTSGSKNLCQFALYWTTGGGEVGGGVVVNELLIIYVQYQAQFTTMNQRFRYKVQSLFFDHLYTINK